MYSTLYQQLNELGYGNSTGHQIVSLVGQAQDLRSDVGIKEHFLVIDSSFFKGLIEEQHEGIREV